MARKVELNAVITQKVEISPELMVLHVAPDGWEFPEFEPGQFAVLGLPGSAHRTPWSLPEEEQPDPGKLIRRAYSIASSPLDRDRIEFYINLVRDGGLTSRLFALQTGDRAWLGNKISGAFTLGDVPGQTNVVLASTGTGLAPYMSMLRTYLPDENRQLAVMHGARYSRDLGYRQELHLMQRLCANFTYISFISRSQHEPLPWKGLTGYVQDQWTNGQLEDAWGFKPSPKDTHVFLCGNPGMCEDMVAVLAKDGFQEQTRKAPGQVHVERYW